MRGGENVDGGSVISGSPLLFSYNTLQMQTGRCVETDEDLGEPLTPFMETFVGVSGPNHGIRFEVNLLILS